MLYAIILIVFRENDLQCTVYGVPALVPFTLSSQHAHPPHSEKSRKTPLKFDCVRWIFPMHGTLLSFTGVDGVSCTVQRALGQFPDI